MITGIQIALSCIAVAFIISPLLRGGKYGSPGHEETDALGRRISELEGRKDACLQYIKEVEFDYQLGKISEEDFLNLQQRYKGEVISLIKEIDLLHEQGNLAVQVEREVKRLRRRLKKEK